MAHRTSQLHIEHRELKPAAHLSKPAKAVFASIVKANSTDHFTRSDIALLESYANHIVLAQEAQRHIDEEGAVVGGKPNPWLTPMEKACKALVALSARLRLCPQSRFDRLKAGTNARPQFGDDDFDDPDGLLARADDGPRSFLDKYRAPRKPLTGLAKYR